MGNQIKANKWRENKLFYSNDGYGISHCIKPTRAPHAFI